MSIDDHGRFISWHPRATALFGYTREEAIGMSLTAIVPESRLDEFAAALTEVRRGAPTVAWETERLRKDGSLVEVELIVSPLLDAAESEERFRRSFADSGVGMALAIAMLAEFGIDYVQGFHTGEPRPLEEIEFVAVRSAG